MVMETLRVQIDKQKARKVRETAMTQFGFSKGAISKAVNAALDEWLHKQQKKGQGPAPDWERLTGVLKDVKMTSVELQHNAFLLKKH